MAAQTPVPGCLRHSGMVFLYVCLDCDEELICARCIVDIHNGHKVAILDDVLSDKEKELQQYIDRVSDTTNPSLQGEITLTEEKIKENGKSFRKMIGDIKDQAEKMKVEIDKCADKLIKLCCELEKSNEDMLKSYKSALETVKDENNMRRENCQQTLNSGTIMEVMENSKEIKRTTGISPVPGKLQNVQFQPGPISVSQLYNSLGFVTEDGIIKATVVSEFTHKSHIITCRTTQDNDAWLSYLKDKNIYKVDQTGEVKETVQCKVKVWSIAISPTTERVWFCCRDDRTVQEVMDDNTIVTRIVTDRAPYMSLCITTNDTVVVGMDWKIAMYTTEGRKVESSGVKGPCTQQAVMPVNMAYCTQTGNVVVADLDNVLYNDYTTGKEPGKQPHIKVMDEYLNVKFRYPCQDTPEVGTHDRGQRDKQPLFYPLDVSFDETGDILVADRVSKSIVLIDGYRGDYIRTVCTDDFIIWSISSHKDGFLWIGMEKKKVKILKYK